MKERTELSRAGRLFVSSVRLLERQGYKSGAMPPRMLRKYGICYIVSGRGTLMINGAIYAAESGDWFALQPGDIAEGNVSPSGPLRFRLLLFDGAQLNKHKDGWRSTALQLPFSGKLPRLSEGDGLAEFRPAASVDGGSAAIKRKYALHALLDRLFAQPAQERSSVPEVGWEAALSFMNSSYMRDVKIGELAQKAGLSTNQFIRTFKKQMEQTPLQYIERQRMGKARQLLFSTAKIKDIARQVGYKDEHYFSRAFKKVEGVAPALYMKSKSRRIAAMYYGLDDYLITLGVQPIAALSYSGRVSYTYPVPALHEANRGGIAFDSLILHYDKLLSMKPDLILTSDRLETDESLCHIAPTAIVQHSNECIGTLHYLAHILGEESSAERWTEQYMDRRAKLRERIRQSWGQPTACFVRICSDFYRVYGAHNQTGTLLHDDLELALPDGFSQRRWIDFRLDEWCGLQADHLFLMIDPISAARERLNRLRHSETWQSLHAVRRNCVHDASDLLFKALGPAGRLSAMTIAAGQMISRE